MTTVTVCIGSEPKQLLASLVLIRSILKRTAASLDIRMLPQQDLKLPMQTGFSFYRWGVPSYLDHRGKAIYLDADTLVLGDILDLWNEPLDKPVLARPWRDGKYLTSVMVMDCAKLAHWNFGELVHGVEEGRIDYNAVMWAAERSPYRNDFGPLPARWNDLDIRKTDTALVHYTGLDRQPWRYSGHPAGALWQQELKAALTDETIRASVVEEEVAKGHVRADLLTVP